MNQRDTALRLGRSAFMSTQAFMQRSVHPSFGRVKFAMYGQEFEKTGITRLSMVTPTVLRLYDGL